MLEEAYDENYKPTEEGERAPRLCNKSIVHCRISRDPAVLRSDRTRSSRGERSALHSQGRNESSTAAWLETRVSRAEDALKHEHYAHATIPVAIFHSPGRTDGRGRYTTSTSRRTRVLGTTRATRCTAICWQRRGERERGPLGPRRRALRKPQRLTAGLKLQARCCEQLCIYMVQM